MLVISSCCCRRTVWPLLPWLACWCCQAAVNMGKPVACHLLQGVCLQEDGTRFLCISSCLLTQCERPAARLADAAGAAQFVLVVHATLLLCWCNKLPGQLQLQTCAGCEHSGLEALSTSPAVSQRPTHGLWWWGSGLHITARCFLCG